MSFLALRCGILGGIPGGMLSGMSSRPVDIPFVDRHTTCHGESTIPFIVVVWFLTFSGFLPAV